MNWSSRIFTEKLSQTEADQVRSRIEAGETPDKICLITLAARQEDLLDIRPAKYLRYDVIRQMCPKIIGIGADEKDALQIVLRLTQDCYGQTGDVCLREYLAGTD